MPAFLIPFLLKHGLTIVAAILGALVGAWAMSHWDAGEIEHQKGLVIAEAMKLETAKKEALVWATEKQRTYDGIAITEARTEATKQTRIAADATQRSHDLAAIPPRVLVRGCITYEFVRQLDAAITGRPPSALPQPAGKPNDTCAPIDAVAVVQRLLGIIAVAEVRGTRLEGLQAFVRAAQAAR